MNIWIIIPCNWGCIWAPFCAPRGIAALVESEECTLETLALDCPPCALLLGFLELNTPTTTKKKNQKTPPPQKKKISQQNHKLY